MSPKTELPPELGDGYELTFARLQRMFRARGVSSHDAADLAQETAARLIVHLRRRGMDPNPLHEGISALIHRIAVNLLIDRARAGRADALPLDDAMHLAGAEDPADVVSRAQQVREVRSAVAGLSQRHRRALALSLDGLGPAEIAEDFGIERNAADALLYRARRRLARSLQIEHLGVAVALMIGRMRAAFRRDDITAPVLSAAPAGMQLAAGIVGIAMTASFSVSPVIDPAATVPARPGPVRVAAADTAAPSSLLPHRTARPEVAAAAARTRTNRVSFGTTVPAGKGDDDLGVRVWQERDGSTTTGPILHRGTTAACSTVRCDNPEVLR